MTPDEPLAFILNLHGGGSHGGWQYRYFPAKDCTETCRLVVATPTAATSAPTRHWSASADDAYLENIVEVACRRGRDRRHILNSD